MPGRFDAEEQPMPDRHPNISTKEEAAQSQSSRAGAMAELRVNVEVLNRLLAVAIEEHMETRSDPVHRRSYLELHRKHALSFVEKDARHAS